MRQTGPQHIIACSAGCGGERAVLAVGSVRRRRNGAALAFPTFGRLAGVRARPHDAPAMGHVPSGDREDRGGDRHGAYHGTLPVNTLPRRIRTGEVGPSGKRKSRRVAGVTGGSVSAMGVDASAGVIGAKINLCQSVVLAAPFGRRRIRGLNRPDRYSLSMSCAEAAATCSTAARSASQAKSGSAFSRSLAMFFSPNATC